jgi:hypothetical protein
MLDCRGFERVVEDLRTSFQDDLAACDDFDEPQERQRCKRGVRDRLSQAEGELRRCREGSLLTGTWTADDGGVYCVRQLGDTLWWAGLSAESPVGAGDFQLGLTFANVFHGQVGGSSISGEWADTPRGTILQHGTLELEVVSATRLRRRQETGGFGGSLWTKTALSPPGDIRSSFDSVRRNDGDTMRAHLKMYKNNVVVYGTVIGDFGANCPPDNVSRRYANFMCNEDDNFDEDELDGDIVFGIRADRIAADNTLGTALDVQPNFWDPRTGWFNDPNHIRAKLDAHDNAIPHCEIIMYGRQAGKDNCAGNVAPLLPGWMENGANSVCVDGRPINGFVNVFPGAPARIFNRSLPQGTRVRVSGVLALDCHGGDCQEHDVGENNVELHPVYALDIIQPTTRADLTGVWGASDVGTYYVRQVGDAVWWLGLSQDRGRTFANVFRGVLTANQAGTFIAGDWADVPLGLILQNGSLTLRAPNFATLDVIEGRGGFGARRWEKLLDVFTGPPGPVG